MSKRSEKANKARRSVRSMSGQARPRLRRDLLSAAVLVALMIAWTIIRYEPTTAPADADVIVYTSSSCSCYRPWIRTLRSEGLAVSVVHAQDVASKQASLGVPRELTGCHTALADGYWIEGHVPASSIAALLNNKPHGVGGLAHLRAPLRNGEKLLWEVVTYDGEGQPRAAARLVDAAKTGKADVTHRRGISPHR